MNLASFEIINYAIRPNKNVERKLIAESLQILEVPFRISSYRYIGFGANSFVDFKLFHRALQIEDMTSIEREAPDRAKFNKPYLCIKVEDGDSTEVLPTINLAEGRSMVWLDYDDKLTNSTALEDIQTLAKTLPSGSLAIFTVNADHRQFDDESVAKAPAEEKGDARLAAMRRRYGDFLPAELPRNPMTAESFPRVAADALMNAMRHALVKATRPDGAEFIPIFNFYYRDSAPMVTVGGMIGNADARGALEASGIRRLRHAQGLEQIVIDVPPLTLREKWAIDSLLPVDPLPTADMLKEAFDFKIDEAQLQSYCRYYKYYPIFSEFHP